MNPSIPLYPLGKQIKCPSFQFTTPDIYTNSAKLGIGQEALIVFNLVLLALLLGRQKDSAHKRPKIMVYYMGSSLKTFLQKT